MPFPVEENIQSEKVAHLEQTIRYYASLARRWENRCLAIEFELAAAQERLAALGHTQYGALDGE